MRNPLISLLGEAQVRVIAHDRMYVEMYERWPDEPRVMGNQAFRSSDVQEHQSGKRDGLV